MEYESLVRNLKKDAKKYTADQRRDLFLEMSQWAEADMKREVLSLDPPKRKMADLYDEAMKKKRSGLQGLPTGYPSLDKLTGGFEGGELILIYGAQNRGKTMVAQSILHNMAVQGIPSLFVTLEMPDEKLIERYDLMQQSIPGAGHGSAKNLPIQFFPLEELDPTPEILEEYIKLVMKEDGIRIVVIDHYSLLPSLDSDQRNSYNMWARHLQRISVKLRVPIILLHHTRKMNDEDGEPSEADIAETQLVANLSHQIIRVWRKLSGTPSEQRVLNLRLVKNKYKGFGGAMQLWIDENYKLVELRLDGSTVPLVGPRNAQMTTDADNVFNQ